MATLHFAFVFKGAFDEDIYTLCPFASASLRSKVILACDKNLAFLGKFKGVHLLSTQVTDRGKTFRVMCERTDFHTENPGVPELYEPGYYP